MAQINKPDEYFNTVLYTGNGTDNHAITGVNFQPDWTWIKPRNEARGHALFDTVRGATKMLISNETSAEGTYATSLKSFDSDGFTLGTSNDVNKSANTHVAWNWLAANGTASNTDGSITSTVSANTTSGFSIVTYTGTGANATVGHGLGSTPNVYIIKRLNGVSTWLTYHSALGIGYHLGLNNTTAQNANDATFANNTAPNSSVVSLGTWGDLNGSGNTYVMYCFAEKKGFSKFGSYTGNGSADGTFVYTGMRPAWLLVKRTDSANDWNLYDNKRLTFNVNDSKLEPNTSDAEATGNSNKFDFLSNGFKARGSSTGSNVSGGTYIYMAFSEFPLVGTNNTPATAR